MLPSAPLALTDAGVAADAFESLELPRDPSSICVAVVARMKTDLMSARTDSLEQGTGPRAIEKVPRIVDWMAPSGDEEKCTHRSSRIAHIHDALERVVGISSAPRLYRQPSLHVGDRTPES